MYSGDPAAFLHKPNADEQARPTRRGPSLLITCAGLAAIAIAAIFGFTFLLAWGWSQYYAWDSQRIGDVKTGMTVKQVKEALACPMDSSEPRPVSEMRSLRSWAQALDDLKPQESVLYYESVGCRETEWRRAFIIFNEQHRVSEVRVFDLQVGMTEDEVRHWCGKPGLEHTAAEVRSMGGNYCLEGYTPEKRDVTGKVLIYDGLDSGAMMVWAIVYIYIDPMGKVERISTGLD